jgi:DNA-binding CsgD family transcriptional regulator
MDDLDARRLELIDRGLSPNEARAVAWVEAGRPQADLARELGVKPQAVASYLRRAREKLALSGY